MIPSQPDYCPYFFQISRYFEFSYNFSYVNSGFSLMHMKREMIFLLSGITGNGFIGL